MLGRPQEEGLTPTGPGPALRVRTLRRPPGDAGLAGPLRQLGLAQGAEAGVEVSDLVKDMRRVVFEAANNLDPME